MLGGASLHSIFGASRDLLWWQECARAILVFAYGLLLVRCAGRRVFGRWSALDIIVSIIIGSNLSRCLTGTAPLFGTLIATTLIMALHWVLSHAVARWRLASRLLEGRAIALVTEGDRRVAAMRRHGISEADLQEALRQSGIETTDAAKAVRLEPSGKISVLMARQP
jgi:uncharacterized membrane protein YcaP (DUF421 family)